MLAIFLLKLNIWEKKVLKLLLYTAVDSLILTVDPATNHLCSFLERSGCISGMAHNDE